MSVFPSLSERPSKVQLERSNSGGIDEEGITWAASMIPAQEYKIGKGYDQDKVTQSIPIGR